MIAVSLHCEVLYNNMKLT